MSASQQESTGKVPRLWRIEGDGMYFPTFWVEADTVRMAAAEACDILAGPANLGPYHTRAYSMVEKHIKQIVEEDTKLKWAK